MIDSDPQGNATSGFGFDKRDIKQCIYDAIINDVPMQDIIRHTAYDRLDIVPATIQLAGAEIELVSLMNREGRLKNSLERVKHNYDYVLIDCPPSLGLLTINGLTAASSVLIPIQCEFYALEGVTMLMNTIQLVQRNLNPALKLEGVLILWYTKNRGKASSRFLQSNWMGKNILRMRSCRSGIERRMQSVRHTIWKSSGWRILMPEGITILKES